MVGRLTEDGTGEVTDAADRLRENDSVELEVKVFGMDCLLLCSSLHNAHVGPSALLIHAVEEGLGRDNLSLGAFLGRLSLLVE